MKVQYCRLALGTEFILVLDRKVVIRLCIEFFALFSFSFAEEIRLLRKN
jgi:hypothetical protein